MKKTILILFASLIAATSIFAQEEPAKENKPAHEKPKYKRHEINVGFANLFNRNGFWETIIFYNYYDYYDYYYYDDYFYYQPYFYEGAGINSTKYGVGYKMHFKKSAIRSYFDVGINNNNNSYTRNGGSITYPSKIESEYSLNTQSFTGRLGYEFIISNNKTDFYFGADLIYQYSNWKYDYESTTTTYNQSNIIIDTDIFSNESKANYHAYGMGPVIGLRYHLNEMISISTETRIDLTSYKQNGSEGSSTYIGSSINTVTYDFSSSGIRTKVTPLGLLSLNVHL